MKLIFILGLSCLIPALGKEIPSARPEEVGLSSERLARIRTILERYVDRREIPGAVTLVARRGRIGAPGSRRANGPGNEKPMRADTIFWIASMTKPVTSVAVMMLYEQGYSC